MIRILTSVIVKKFYERNAVFFLFIFFLLFGMVESSQIVSFHLALIYGMIGTPIFLAVVCALWFLYLMKCILFFNNVLSLSENSFLKNMNVMRKPQQFSYLLFAIVMMDLLVLAYSFIVVSIAFYIQQFTVGVFVILFHALLIALVTWFVLIQINSTKPTWHFPVIRWRRPKPFVFFYLNLLTSRLNVVLFITKVFSIGVLILFIRIPTDHYEYRLALMGLMFGLAGHTVIIFEFRKLEDQSMNFLKALPLSFSKRWIQLFALYSILFLPEIVVSIINHIHLIDVVIIWVSGVSFMIYCHCSLYNELNMDKHLQRIFSLFLAGFALSLFKLAIPASLLLLIWSFIKYKRDYYLYEVG